MKMLACLAVFCGIVGAGLTVYLRAAARVRFFAGLVAFCNHLAVEIGFTRTPISQVIDNYITVYPREFARTLSAYQKLLNTRADITRERCAALSDIPQVADFFFELGRHGAQEEQSKISGALGTFTEMKNTAELNKKVRAVVILKLSIICGIAGVILLL